VSSLEETYTKRREDFLAPVGEKLEGYIKQCLSTAVRIDRVSARAKDVERFVQKAAKVEDAKPKYRDPLSEIQDQIGARIVTFYPSDVPRVAEVVKRYFHPIEAKMIVPDSESEFGYSGQHFILLLPTDVTVGFDPSNNPSFFELQIKTLFQHAWSEAEHDLGYKPTTILSSLQKRKMAFTAAQAWGADQIFDELFAELNP
jgi:putative GTP pyrophosphokinase